MNFLFKICIFSLEVFLSSSYRALMILCRNHSGTTVVLGRVRKPLSNNPDLKQLGRPKLKLESC